MLEDTTACIFHRSQPPSFKENSLQSHESLWFKIVWKTTWKTLSTVLSILPLTVRKSHILALRWIIYYWWWPWLNMFEWLRMWSWTLLDWLSPDIIDTVWLEIHGLLIFFPASGTSRSSWGGVAVHLWYYVFILDCLWFFMLSFWFWILKIVSSHLVAHLFGLF